jgi:hypothetical protein
MKLVMKIQSISDIITNSSTEVFVVYDSSNIKSIKDLVNTILSIDGHYTFDDLFTIKMNPNDNVVDEMYNSWEDFFPNDPKPESLDDYWEFLDALPQEELNKIEKVWDNCRDHCYYYDTYSFYEGYSVSIKEGIEKTDKLQRAVDAIRSLDSIFDIDYGMN